MLESLAHKSQDINILITSIMNILIHIIHLITVTIISLARPDM